MPTSRLLLTALLIATISHLSMTDSPAIGSELEPLLKTLKSVGPKGAGNREARPAWQELTRADARELPTILSGLDDAGPLAANWIRTAVDVIAQRELDRGGKLPAAELERFVLDTVHAPRARRLAYEWLRRVDRSAPRRLLPDMLDDPSLEMRRDAVAMLIDQAVDMERGEKSDQAVPLYDRALTAARDADQVRWLADRLRKLGRPVDLPRHFGFLVRWKAIGPFDNTDRKGFDAVYPPEKSIESGQEIDLNATYQGKHGEVKWVNYVTSGDQARVDLNKALVEEKSVIGYATTEFVSQRQREVDVRVTSHNAVKVWVNGRLIVRHHVYHSGSQMDQYVGRVVLNPGRNAILVKVGQNEITQSWARWWGFQLRVCDSNGTAILSADRDRKAPQQ